MDRGNLTDRVPCGRLGSARAHSAGQEGLNGESPPLPQGPGDGQSPEELDKLAEMWYARKMREFVANVPVVNAPKARRRVSWNDYKVKNCEEAWPG